MALKPPSRKDLRRFGLVLGVLLAAAGLVPLLRGGPVRLWAEAAAVPVLGVALAAPALLWPVHWLFLKIGMVLGWVNTRILLGIMFYVVITPIGLVKRVMHRRSGVASYWHVREPVDLTKQMEHPF
jgi:hypothetical protein